MREYGHYIHQLTDKELLYKWNMNRRMKCIDTSISNIMQSEDPMTKALVIKKMIKSDSKIKESIQDYLRPDFLLNEKRRNRKFDTNFRRGLDFAIYTVLRGLSTRTLHGTLVKVCDYVFCAKNY